MLSDEPWYIERQGKDFDIRRHSADGEDFIDSVHYLSWTLVVFQPLLLRDCDRLACIKCKHYQVLVRTAYLVCGHHPLDILQREV